MLFCWLIRFLLLFCLFATYGEKGELPLSPALDQPNCCRSLASEPVPLGPAALPCVHCPAHHCSNQKNKTGFSPALAETQLYICGVQHPSCSPKGLPFLLPLPSMTSAPLDSAVSNQPFFAPCSSPGPQILTPCPFDNPHLNLLPIHQPYTCYTATLQTSVNPGTPLLHLRLAGTQPFAT